MNFIVAVSENFAIGKNNDLLFNIPKDLAYFKEHTLDKVVVMGERTFHSLPFKPLKRRVNIVLSDNPNFNHDGVIVARSLSDLFEKLKEYSSEDIFVIGGGSVYNLMMPYCRYAYITKVRKNVPDADTFINNIEKMGTWKLISESEVIEENNLAYTFNIYENTETKPAE